MMQECQQYGTIAANQVGYHMFDRRICIERCQVGMSLAERMIGRLAAWFMTGRPAC